MISGYQSALSGLKAFSTKIESNAHNIANANTDGFKRSRVTNASVDPTGVKPQISRISTPGASVFQETEAGMQQVELSNVDLATEIVDLNLNSTLYKANLKTLESINEMTGELLKIKS